MLINNINILAKIYKYKNIIVDFLIKFAQQFTLPTQLFSVRLDIVMVLDRPIDKIIYGNQNNIIVNMAVEELSMSDESVT